MFLKEPKWVTKATEDGNPYEESLDKVPYICFIGNVRDNLDATQYGAVEKTWENDDNEGKRCEIPFTEHGKGFIYRSKRSDRGDLEVEISTGGTKPDAGNLILPSVRTYSYSRVDDKGRAEYVETYDSAKINIESGTVTVYSAEADPAYLVVIS